MQDQFNRKIEYLRVSITDRCNFRCIYCMPTAGIKQVGHNEILSFEEILRLVRILTLHGLTRVRVTGGEPLVRRGVIGFIRQLSVLSLTDIALTTNGSMLTRLADGLKQAGLKRVNISLDSADAVNFQRLTGGGRLADSLQGIDAALKAELSVKINVVATSYLTDADLRYFVNLTRTHPVIVRFIEYMPIGCNPDAELGISMSGLRDRISAIGGSLQPTRCSEGGGPAQYYSLAGAGKIGFILPISEHFCQRCNRIRLTADGKIKPCLLSNDEYDVKTPMRQGISDAELATLLLQAVRQKPAGHSLTETGSKTKRLMSQIGG